MKNWIYAIGITLILVSCSDATDGDPATDTSTTIPPDTAVMKGLNDDGGTINTNTGSYSTDSVNKKKSDVRSSSSAYPNGSTNKKDSMLP